MYLLSGTQSSSRADALVCTAIASCLRRCQEYGTLAFSKEMNASIHELLKSQCYILMNADRLKLLAENYEYRGTFLQFCSSVCEFVSTAAASVECPLVIQHIWDWSVRIIENDIVHVFGKGLDHEGHAEKNSKRARTNGQHVTTGSSSSFDQADRRLQLSATATVVIDFMLDMYVDRQLLSIEAGYLNFVHDIKTLQCGVLYHPTEAFRRDCTSKLLKSVLNSLTKASRLFNIGDDEYQSLCQQLATSSLHLIQGSIPSNFEGKFCSCHLLQKLPSSLFNEGYAVFVDLRDHLVPCVVNGRDHYLFTDQLYNGLKTEDPLTMKRCLYLLDFYLSSQSKDEIFKGQWDLYFTVFGSCDENALHLIKDIWSRAPVLLTNKSALPDGDLLREHAKRTIFAGSDTEVDYETGNRDSVISFDVPIVWKWIELLLHRALSSNVPSARRSILLNMVEVNDTVSKSLIQAIQEQDSVMTDMNSLPLGFHLPLEFICGDFLGYIGDKAYYKGTSGGLVSNLRKFFALYYGMLNQSARKSFLLNFFRSFPGKTKEAKTPFRMCAELVSDFHQWETGRIPSFLQEGYGTVSLASSVVKSVDLDDLSNACDNPFLASCCRCADMKPPISVFDANLDLLHQFSEATSRCQTKLMFTRCLIPYLLLLVQYTHPKELSISSLSDLLGHIPCSFASETCSPTQPLKDEAHRRGCVGNYDPYMNFLALVDWIRVRADRKLEDDHLRTTITAYLDDTETFSVEGLCLLMCIYVDNLDMEKILEVLESHIEGSSTRLYQKSGAGIRVLTLLKSLFSYAKQNACFYQSMFQWVNSHKRLSKITHFCFRKVEEDLNSDQTSEEARLSIDVIRQMVFTNGQDNCFVDENCRNASSDILIKAFERMNSQDRFATGGDELAVYILCRLLFCASNETVRTTITRRTVGPKNDFVIFLEAVLDRLMPSDRSLETVTTASNVVESGISFPMRWYGLAAVHRLFHSLYGDEDNMMAKFDGYCCISLDKACNSLAILSNVLRSNQDRKMKHTLLNCVTSNVIPLVRCIAVSAMNAPAGKRVDCYRKAIDAIVEGTYARATWNEKCWYDFTACLLSPASIIHSFKSTNKKCIGRDVLQMVKSAIGQIASRAQKGGVSPALQAIAASLGTLLRTTLRSTALIDTDKTYVLSEWSEILYELLLYREPLTQGEIATVVDKHARSELLQRLYSRIQRKGAEADTSVRWAYHLQSYLQKAFSRPAACNHNGRDLGMIESDTTYKMDDIFLPWNVDANMPDLSEETYDDEQSSSRISSQVSISRIARVHSLFLLDDLVSLYPRLTKELANGLLVKLVEFVERSASEKNSYLPGSEQHGKRLRALQAGSLLSKRASRTTALKIFPMVINILLGVELASTRYYLELIASNLSILFPEVIEASSENHPSLIQALQDINLKQMPAFSVVLLSSRTLVYLDQTCSKQNTETASSSDSHFATHESSQYVSIRDALFHALFPWICGNTTTVRSVAQLAILHSKNSLRTARSKDPLVEHLFSTLHNSSMSQTIVDKFEAVIFRFGSFEQSSMEGILTSCISDHGELVPKDTFSILKLIHHEIVREESDTQHSETIGSNKARTDPELEEVQSLTWLVHAGFDLVKDVPNEILRLQGFLAGEVHEASMTERTDTTSSKEDNYQRKIKPWEYTRIGLGARTTGDQTTYKENISRAGDSDCTNWSSSSFPCQNGDEGIIKSMVNQISGRRHQPVIMCAALVDKTPNLGGLARTSEVFSAETLVVPDKSVLADRGFQDVSVSAAQWLPIHEVSPARLSEYLKLKRREGYTIVGLEQTAKSQPMDQYSFPESVVLVLGKEKEGLPAEIIAQVDVCVEIPQLGIIRSLNVHVSGAMLLWEYTRQRLVRHTHTSS